MCFHNLERRLGSAVCIVEVQSGECRVQIGPQADVEPDQLLPGEPRHRRPGHGHPQLHPQVGGEASKWAVLLKIE